MSKDDCMYKSVSGKMNFPEREKDVLKFWNDNNVFKESVLKSKGGEEFTFFDGPPTANGKPHVGHVLTRAIKDLIPRYKTMKGYNVLRKAGWDTHGLPVELEVEKTLGINGKPEIEKYGIGKFNQDCKRSVWKYKTEWEQMSDSIGYWVDMENPYVTYDNNYIESVWWAIKSISEKGLLYKGHKIVPYCPRCGTSLSSHEVSQGYSEVTEKSIYVKFKVKNRDNVYLLAWTTTPWTLPSNVALVVNPEINYIEAQVGDDILIVSEELAEKLLDSYEKIKGFKGSEIEGLEYEPLFNFATVNKKAWFVVADDYVKTTEGTGIVHVAPAFGEDDARVGNKYDLPFIQLVDARGCFPESVTPWAGMFVKDADPKIIKYLKERGSLFLTKEHTHTYPFCWRCDTPLLYYAMDTWFIKMTEVKDRLIANNNSINWIPENIKAGRMGNFLENIVDWGLSRSRYWGTPLPVWECECGHFHVVGSREELVKLGGEGVSRDIELHRPYVDDVLIKCDKCGKPMKRVKDVIDCWFDSGSMPFAQHHYPFENKDLFEKNFPADFISEAIDQTRGWFYTLLAISTVLFDKAPFKNCIVLGHVNDKNGIKMSKHKGNVISPQEIISKQGADAVRWYFYVNSSPWLPSRFYEEAISEAQRKFMGTLWNVYSFYVLYANIDNFDPSHYKLEDLQLSLIDKWILSRLNTVIKHVSENLDNYKITESAREIQDFVDNLSNWYVRRGRERYWKSDMPSDKISAYVTLYEVLVTLSKVIAPFVPFISEEIYQNLVRSIYKDACVSVHLCGYPEYNESFMDEKLERDMQSVLSIVGLGRACRNSAAIKNRQPLGLMYVKSKCGNVPEKYVDLIKDELNIKTVKFVEDSDEFVTYKFKPQLKVVGPKFGKLLGKISKFLSEIKDGNAAMNELKSTGFISFNVEDREIKLDKESLLIDVQQVDGYVFDQDSEFSVILDTRLTDDLIEEGFVREIVNKIQTMRKESEFEVMDHIQISYISNDVIKNIMEKNSKQICKETLSDSLIHVDLIDENEFECVKTWDVNGEKINLALKR